MAPLGVKSFRRPARSGGSELPPSPPHPEGSSFCPSQRTVPKGVARRAGCSQPNTVLKPNTFCVKWESELFMFRFLRFHPTPQRSGNSVQVAQVWEGNPVCAGIS